MNRRSMLKKIGLLSAGTMLWSSCDFSKETYHFLTKEERSFLSNLSDQILPSKDKEAKAEALKDRVAFIERIVEHCFEPEEIALFRKGLVDIEKSQPEKTELSAVVAKLDLERIAKAELPQPAEAPELTDEDAILLCYESVRGLSIQHFTSTEQFMTKELKWKFIPGGYQACVAI